MKFSLFLFGLALLGSTISVNGLKLNTKKDLSSKGGLEILRKVCADDKECNFKIENTTNEPSNLIESTIAGPNTDELKELENVEIEPEKEFEVDGERSRRAQRRRNRMRRRRNRMRRRRNRMRRRRNRMRQRRMRMQKRRMRMQKRRNLMRKRRMHKQKQNQRKTKRANKIRRRRRYRVRRIRKLNKKIRKRNQKILRQRARRKRIRNMILRRRG